MTDAISRVVIGMDPDKRSVTIEVMTAEESVVGGGRFGTDPVGFAAVVTAFLTGWPSIIAVILNYVKRGDVRGTWLESHFRWQIRTFWYGLLWVVLCGVFVIFTLGMNRNPLSTRSTFIGPRLCGV